MTTPLLWAGPDDGPVLVLAHGAGAAMDSDWMTRMTGLLADAGVRTARFEFAYMAARREGGRKPPPRAETLKDEYLEIVARVGDAAGGPIAIGGKSMGGRVASLIADEEHDAGRVRALVCLGYPFHPPGRPEKLRTAHLEGIRVPTIVCQGTRDPFGTREEVPGFGLASGVELFWLEDGEHELKPRVRISGHTHAEHLGATAARVAEFLGA